MSAQTKELLSIAQVCEMIPGDKDNPVWVDDFTGVVNRIENREAKATGKKFWVCKVGDLTGSAEIEMSVFTAPRFAEGDVIEVTGQGMRRTEYNGTAQVALSQKSQVLKVAQSAHHQEQQERRATSQPAINGATFTVPGPTVGMAMNNALELLTKGLDVSEIKPQLCLPSFWAAVHEVASDIIRCARLLEMGKLAPPVRERAGGAPEPHASPAPPPAQPPASAGRADPPRAPKPQPGPGGSVALPEQEDDSIPF